MVKLSAGVLLFRRSRGKVEVLIGHPGGPFWAKKDLGSWSIIKGEYDDGEDPWEVAKREFREEVGSPIPDGQRYDLGEVRQPSGKRITAFAVESDFDTAGAMSNEFEMEWPKGSGRLQSFPEIDKIDWFSVPAATEKLLKGQRPFLRSLIEEAQLSSVEKGDDGDGSAQQGSLF